MSEGEKMGLERASNLAKRIMAGVKPGCARIELVGSIRRGRPEVGDVEFVYIPRFQVGGQINFLDLEAKTENVFDKVLLSMIDSKPNFHKGPRFAPRYKTCLIDLPEGGQFKIEFWIAKPETWGFIKAMRTGSEAFNKAWAVRQMDRGWLPNKFRFAGGWLTQGGQRVQTPTERGLFEIIGLPWVEPKERTRQTVIRYQHQFGKLPAGFSQS